MNAKIVIVEDEEDLLELLEYNLTKEGFEVIGFLNTKIVEQMLMEEDIDILIMDRNLPGVEGSEFVQSLRKDGFTTPVIYLSAKNAYEENSKIYSLLIKPTITLNQTNQAGINTTQNIQDIKNNNLRNIMVNTYLENDNYYKITA